MSRGHNHSDPLGGFQSRELCVHGADSRSQRRPTTGGAKEAGMRQSAMQRETDSQRWARRGGRVAAFGVAWLAAIGAPGLAVAGDGPRRGPGRGEVGEAGEEGEGSGGEHGEHRGHMKAHFAQMLWRDVGLKEAKALQIEAIFERQHQAARARHDVMRDQRHALKALLEKDSNDQKAYQQAIDALHVAHEELHALRKAALLEARKLLAPKEQAKLLRSMFQARRHMMHKRFGPPGGAERGPKGGHRGEHGPGHDGPEHGAYGGPDEGDGR